MWYNVKSRQGSKFMKTKIIYISNNKTFNALEIQAAFDEVRKTLALPADTVIFGVPLEDEIVSTTAIDTDETLETTPDDINIDMAETESENEVIEHIQTATQYEEAAESNDETANFPILEKDEINSDIDIIKIFADSDDMPQSEPEIVDFAIIDEEEVIEEIPEIIEPVQSFDDENEVDDEDKVIPILSILSGNNSNASDIADDIIDTDEIIKDFDDSDDIAEAFIAETGDEDNFADLPEYIPAENSIESIFEKMRPLQDDSQNVTKTEQPEKEVISVTKHESVESVVSEILKDNENNINKNLKKLATEYQKSEKNIETKSESGGKIGRLKNILPFKKSRQSESGAGALSSLFDWAGVAANDDDFSIPSYFPSSK